MKLSAGILLYKYIGKEIYYFLVHPGGPLWSKKDEGAWSIPKGEYGPDEEPLSAAQREFQEETGEPLKSKTFIELGFIKLKSGKQVWAWGCEGDLDVSKMKSNTFEMLWPPKSGKLVSFPEIDRGGWFKESEAKLKMNENQTPFLDRLKEALQSKE